MSMQSQHSVDGHLDKSENRKANGVRVISRAEMADVMADAGVVLSF